MKKCCKRRAGGGNVSRNEPGFTLIELIVAMTILLVLTSMALPWRGSR